MNFPPHYMWNAFIAQYSWAHSDRWVEINIIIIHFQRFSGLNQNLSENSSGFGAILTTGTED